MLSWLCSSPDFTRGKQPEGSDRKLALTYTATWKPGKAMLTSLVAVACCLLVVFGAVVLPMLASGCDNYLGVMGFSHTDTMTGDHLYTMDADQDEHYALVTDHHHASLTDDRMAMAALAASESEWVLAATPAGFAADTGDTPLHLYLTKNIIGSSE